MGGQASWLLPAALLALGAGLLATRRAPRTDRTRAALLLWGGWLIVSGLVFSLSSGVIHTYYTVALAPAIAALVAIGGRMLWARRDTARARLAAAAAVARERRLGLGAPGPHAELGAVAAHGAFWWAERCPSPGSSPPRCGGRCDRGSPSPRWWSA